MKREIYSAAAVRRAAWQFLTGKAVSAALTFAILLSLVRVLPLAEYGAYAVFIAGIEVGVGVAGLGLQWLAARHLPDYVLHADGRLLGRLCRQLVLWQLTALVALACLSALAVDAYLRWSGLAAHRDVAWLALVLLVADGLGHFLREGMMAPLLLQGPARVSLVLRQASFLVAIAVFAYLGLADLSRVLAAELAASALGAVVAGIALRLHLRKLRSQVAEPGWRQPRRAEQWRLALRMYVAQLITLAAGHQMLLNLVQRALGAEAAGLFGFLRVLYQQIGRYLPATLLFTVLRPKLIASHILGGMAVVQTQANLAGKLSLAALLPIIVFVALAGDPLLTLLSGGKFTEGGDYFLGLLLALVPLSQRQIIETLAVACGRPALCTMGSSLALLGLPIAIYMLDRGLGLWAPVAAILFGQAAFNASVQLGLAGTGYHADWRGTAKLAASALLAWLAASAALLVVENTTSIVLACVLAGLVFVGLAWRLQVFTGDERRRLDGILGRPMFAR